MKLPGGIIRSLIVVCCTAAAAAAGQVSASGRLDTTFTVLLNRNGFTISTLKKNHIGLEDERNRLLHSVSMNIAPATTAHHSENGMTFYPQASFSATVGECSAWLNADNSGAYGESGGGFMIPLRSTVTKRAAILDSMIDAAGMRGYYQAESILLSDIRELFSLVATLLQTEEEIAVRNDALRQIDSIGVIVARFTRAGQINSRSARQLELATDENRLQIALLEKRTVLYKQQIADRFLTGPQQTAAVIDECSREIRRMLHPDTATARTPPHLGTVADDIDSLALRLLQLRQRLLTMNDYAVKAGPLVTLDDGTASPRAGIGIQCTFSFLTKKSDPIADTCLQGNPPLPDYRSTVTVADTAIGDIDGYITRCRDEITSIISELQLGAYYSLPWLSDLFSRIVNARLTAAQTRYDVLRYRIAILQSLDAIGLRPDLMARYFNNR